MRHFTSPKDKVQNTVIRRASYLHLFYGTDTHKVKDVTHTLSKIKQTQVLF